MSQTNPRTRAQDQKQTFECETQWRAAINMIHDTNEVIISNDGPYLRFAFDSKTKEKIGFFNKQRNKGYVSEHPS
jgi:hypothetical protein